MTASRVEYLLVGGHALAYHGVPRFTKDMHFWVNPTADNAERLLAALEAFGFADVDLTPSDFTVEGRVVQLGQPPVRIDLVTSVDGLAFRPAYGRKLTCDYCGVRLTVISREDLIANKRASGRPQDLVDVALLTADEPG